MTVDRLVHDCEPCFNSVGVTRRHFSATFRPRSELRNGFGLAGPAHEILAGVLHWIVRIKFGQAPQARVFGRLEAECAAFGADNESAVLKHIEKIFRVTSGHVEDRRSLAHGKGYSAIIAAVVPSDDLEIEGLRFAGDAFPGR